MVSNSIHYCSLKAQGQLATSTEQDLSFGVRCAGGASRFPVSEKHPCGARLECFEGVRLEEASRERLLCLWQKINAKELESEAHGNRDRLDRENGSKILVTAQFAVEAWSLDSRRPRSTPPSCFAEGLRERRCGYAPFRVCSPSSET